MTSGPTGLDPAAGPVTFYVPEPGLDALRQLDPDRDWRRFTSGERAWVLQTYLRLRQAGFPVDLSDKLPGQGVVVMSGQRRKQVRLDAGQRRRLLIVATVQDLSFPAVADVHLVQDPRQLGPVYAMPITFWPQPGLVPRDASRGARIERIEFKGATENLHPAFRTARWVSQLAALGVEWVADAMPSADLARDAAGVHWNDYREVDLTLSVRPAGVVAAKGKPASKLTVAWLAGSAALLGPEPSFRALRRSDLDYVEVTSPADALRQIAALKDDPARYLAMIENGRRRGAAFSVERVTQEWADILFRRLPGIERDPAFLRWRHLSVPLRRLHGVWQR